MQKANIEIVLVGCMAVCCLLMGHMAKAQHHAKALMVGRRLTSSLYDTTESSTETYVAENCPDEIQACLADSECADCASGLTAFAESGELQADSCDDANEQICLAIQEACVASAASIQYTGED